MSKAEPARQFGKLYWDVKASPAARIVAAYIEYRCGKKPRVILRSEIEGAVQLGHKAVTRAIKEALDLGLIHRRRSRRPGDSNQMVYSVSPFDGGGKKESTHGHDRAEVDAETSRESDSIGTPGGDQKESTYSPKLGAATRQNESPHEGRADQSDQGKSNQEQKEERARDLSPRSFVTQDHIEAIRSAGDAWEYYRTTGSPRWTEALGECIASLGLSPKQVAEALRRWDEGFHGDSPSEARPSRDAIWFWQSRGWLTAALGIEGPARPVRSGERPSVSMTGADQAHWSAVAKTAHVTPTAEAKALAKMGEEMLGEL